MTHLLRRLWWSVVIVMGVLAVGAVGGLAMIGAITVLNEVSNG